MYKKLISNIKKILKYNKQEKLQFYPGDYHHHPLDLVSLKKLFFFFYTSANRSGFPSDLSREDLTLAQKNIFLTYGEILPEGLDRLFQFVRPGSTDNFVDLGSGAGKAVLQSFLCTDIMASYGVEIDNARYKVAEETLQDLKEKLPHLFNNSDKLIEFYNCNILDFDFNKVSIIFSNATCFGPNLMDKIVEKINCSSTVRVIMTTHKIEGLINLTNEVIIEIETSWHIPPDKSNCYVYFKPI